MIYVFNPVELQSPLSMLLWERMVFVVVVVVVFPVCLLSVSVFVGVLCCGDLSFVLHWHVSMLLLLIKY